MRIQKKALLIYNPTAHTCAHPDMWLGTIVHGLCTQFHCLVFVQPTRSQQKGSDLLAQVGIEPDVIIAAGGDGTIRDVLEGIAETGSDVPVGIIPLGTGNQLARNLGIYEDNLLGEPLEDALNAIVHGTIQKIDLGRMNGRYFAVAAGAGPMSDAVITPSREDKTSWKMLAYASSMIQSFAVPPVVFRVTANGDCFQVAASGIFVSNVSDLGVGTISKTAELSDGLLDLCILNPTKFTDYLELGFHFAGGFVGGEAPYYIRKVKTVNIEVVPQKSPMSSIQRVGHKIRSFLKGQPESALPVLQEVAAMIDGDACGTTPMRIEVVPRAVSVFVPPSRSSN